ncbi:MAG: histidinol-phosphate aminotransferase family protein [Candidatus Omnitrophica bacterium]|nr:histidinol-phosphate aminotransferase family protein [Candidatus Omnitrophota bacterium]
MIQPKRLLLNISRAPSNTENRLGKVMRLDHNERTTPLPQAVLDAVWKTVSPEEVVAYPALESLYRKLAASLGVPRECLLLTYGSDTGIRMVFDTYLNEGDEVVMLDPGYGMFPVYTDMFGGKRVFVKYDADFSLPVTRIIEKINDNTKLVILANPNHTGTAMADGDILKVIQVAATHNALVLVDEAYHYFYEKTMIGQLPAYDNLIIVRTMSKAFGIAPLRVGYLVSQSANINNLIKVKLTYDVTTLSAKFAEYLIDHPSIGLEYVRDVNEGKAYLADEFKKLGAKVFPSVTNFVFVRLPEGSDAVKLVRALEARDIWIKGPFKGVPVDGYIRITVGPRAQMAIFMEHVKELMGKKHEG